MLYLQILSIVVILIMAYNLLVGTREEVRDGDISLGLALGYRFAACLLVSLGFWLIDVYGWLA